MHQQFPRHRINIIDTPGHVDFTVEVERSLRILDGGVSLFCAVGGVESQSETVWKQADKHGVPRIAFINKMDRAGADFDRVIHQMRDRLGANPVPIQLPIGVEDGFQGVIDLVRLKAIRWDDQTLGMRHEVFEIPPALRDLAMDHHARLVAAAAEGDDELLHKYLEDDRLSVPEIKRGLRARTLRGDLVLVTCGSAFRNKGVQAVLDAIVEYLPSPADKRPVVGELRDGQRAECRASDSEPFAALAFKVATDPEVGSLTFFRVYSGVLRQGESVYNPRLGEAEPVRHLVQLHANERAEIDEVRAGDIAAAVGLARATTGDSLVASSRPVMLKVMEFSAPVMAAALEPRRAEDRPAVVAALQMLAAEDPTWLVRDDFETGEIIVSGMGELHLEILVDRLRREHGLDARMGRPQVAYREAIQRAAVGEGRAALPVQGRESAARVVLRVSPLPPGSGLVFAPGAAALASLSAGLLGALEQGAREQAGHGRAAGFGLNDLRVELLAVEVSAEAEREQLCRAAASAALRSACDAAGPVLMEPLMAVEVSTPPQAVGDINGDLARRRGAVQAIEGGPAGMLIRAEAPLAEMFGYATSLRSLSQGRATFSMQFLRYAAAPGGLAGAGSNTH
jgi:elongation factor G